MAYTKIQKTGSGAFHNLLSRYALTHNVTVAIRRMGIFPSVATQSFLLNKPPYKDYHSYNVFMDHARFDRETQMKYMAPDTVFITQIRHPFTHAQSAYYLFEMKKNFKMSFEEYLRSAEKLPPNNTPFCPVRNFQAYVLGYGLRATRENNLTKFQSFLKSLDKQLYFVSLLEFREESMVLMKRKMNWHIKDVLRIHTHKSRPGVKKTSPEMEQAHNETMRLHRELSKLDYALYDFFKDRLFNEIAQQPPDFYEELEFYRALNIKFSEFCDGMCAAYKGVNESDIVKIRRMLNTSIIIPTSKFCPAFPLTYTDCLLLDAPELVLERAMKVRQYPDACSNLKAKSYHDYVIQRDDCCFEDHVYPGYHIKFFKQSVLDTKACVDRFYVW